MIVFFTDILTWATSLAKNGFTGVAEKMKAKQSTRDRKELACKLALCKDDAMLEACETEFKTYTESTTLTEGEMTKWDIFKLNNMDVCDETKADRDALISTLTPVPGSVPQRYYYSHTGYKQAQAQRGTIPPPTVLSNH